MPPTLSQLKEWARGAGQILAEGFGREHEVRHKGVIDIVTEMDRRSEAFLVEQVRAHFPDHQILAEESGRWPGEVEHIWFIDPLDGTTNYAHGFPFFSVSIAYAHQGQVMLGVVYDPIRDECFSAERGAGAWLNDVPTRVSTNRELIKALLVTGFPYDLSKYGQNNLEYFSRFSTRCQSIRRLGSAALDFCYVACGRLDGYWEIRLEPWDIAAGALIAAEAGATITRVSGDPDYLQPPYDSVVANPILHRQMLAVLNG